MADVELPALKNARIGTAGYVSMDQHVVLDTEIARGGNTVAAVSQSGGGGSANVACAVTALGGLASFVGHAGADAMGTGLLAELRERNVEYRVHRVGRSVVIVCLVHTDQQRSFLFDPGHALTLTVQDINPRWLENLGVLHFSSFPFFTEPAATAFRHLARLARERGIPVTIDAGASNAIVEFGVDRYLALLAELQPTILFGNDDEARVLGFQEGLHPSDLPKGVSMAVLHRGPRSTICVSGADHLEVEVPDSNRILDTTGAGDAFSGGFLAAWAQGATAVEAISVGHHLAVRVLETVSARLPLGSDCTDLMQMVKGAQ